MEAMIDPKADRTARYLLRQLVGFHSTGRVRFLVDIEQLGVLVKPEILCELASPPTPSLRAFLGHVRPHTRIPTYGVAVVSGIKVTIPQWFIDTRRGDPREGGPQMAPRYG